MSSTKYKKTLYKKQKFKVNEITVATILKGPQGSANLVAIYNLSIILYGSEFGVPGTYKEQSITDFLKDALQESIREVAGISAAQAKEAEKAIVEIRTEFSLLPRLGAHTDFVPNGSTLFCQILDLPLLHGWVIDPENSSYDSLKELSHSQVVDHYMEGQGDHLEACQRLLEDYSNGQLTSYGFQSISKELDENGMALLFCRDRLEVIYNHNGALLIYVTDQTIREKMPQAVWMLFEERQEETIYLSDLYIPVKPQPYEEKAKKWYKEFLLQLKHKEPQEDKGKEASLSSHAAPAEPAPSQPAPAEPAPSQPAPAEPAAAPAPLEPSEGIEEESSEPSEAGRKEEEDKSGKERSKATCSQAVGSHHTDGGDTDVVPQQDGASSDSSPPQAQSVDGAGSVSSSESSATTGTLTTDGVEFLKFLDEFKDNGCSTYYFEGIVAAFALQKPQFYVPYEFIMAFNEPLALKIQDTYSGIYEDLKKAVVFYLSKKGVDSSDVVLKILGRPDAKSVQLFLDFLESIVLHEQYSVYGEPSQAVPSYDSRRMALGYLGCIVAKFKSGRSWAGKWCEANLKVLNGSKFVIDLEEDFELDAESGFLDLNRFCTTVLDRLKINGQFPPYFDELADDHMFITECFGNADKWPRFLELISYPLALKPPLVRAAFICNVYIAGDGNSSGDPPTYRPLSSLKNSVDWRHAARIHPLLKKVYYHNRKFLYLIDVWSAKHWHVFKFSRHSIQHVLGYTKGDDLIQKIKDIAIVDILLARTICKAIAAAFRFLVLNCGVNGLFSSAWRHYVGSDYVDKPNEEDTTDEIVLELLDTISEQNKSGYVYCEISLYSEPNHVSVVMSDADLVDIHNFLNSINKKCVQNGAHLKCGSIKLWNCIRPATEESAERSAIVVEGPYSADYDSVYLALVEFLGLPPTL